MTTGSAFSTPFRAATTTPFGDTFHDGAPPPPRMRDSAATALRLIELEFTQAVNIPSLAGFLLTDDLGATYALSAPTATADPKIWTVSVAVDLPVFPRTLTLTYDGAGTVVAGADPVIGSTAKMTIYEFYAQVGAPADEFYAQVGDTNTFYARAA